MRSVSHLPDADNGVGDKDQEDDDGLHEGGGRFLSFLKQSQHLHEKRTRKDILHDKSSGHVVAHDGGRGAAALVQPRLTTV